MVNDVLETRPTPKAAHVGAVMGPPLEPRRVCSQCGGTVEVIAITRKTAAGRQMPTKIGACIRCAQWFNEAGLGELNRYVTPSES